MRQFPAASIAALAAQLSCVGAANAGTATSGFIAQVEQGRAILQTVQCAPNDCSYATSHVGDQGRTANCARGYRAFDVRGGAYLGFDGYRHNCP